MKVGIFGSYFYGNFGDDLMALMFAEVVKECGGEPLVYKLDNNLSEQYNIKTVNSIEKLVKESNFCIIGGGGFLVNHKNVSSVQSDRNKRLHELVKNLEKYNCSIYPLSIGGSGTSRDVEVLEGMKKLLLSERTKLVTVRNQEDLKVVKRYNNNVKLFNDVVWQLPLFFNVKKSNQKEKIKVGININKGKKTKAIDYMVNRLLNSKKNSYEIYYMDTHLPEYDMKHEYMPNLNEKNIKLFHYTNPDEITQFISELDILVTQKLHVGVAALSYGVPFISLNGADKTKTFLTNMNLEDYYVGKLNLLKLSKLIKSKNLSVDADFDNFESVKSDSYNHIRVLKEIINDHKAL
ncbi:polysaccharide pyruvyl transferase family protein [Halobacillus faecis]